MKKIILSLTALALILSSCGNSEKKEKEVSTHEIEEIDEQLENEEVVEETVEEEVKAINLELSATDQMTFDKNELIVKEGQEVTLTLTHVGELPKEAMGHNFVLLKQGTDIDAFALKAMETSVEDNYIPEGDEIIANTGIVGGGSSISITFIAPAKGTYDYICSFPGHYSMMKGKFIVE